MATESILTNIITTEAVKAVTTALTARAAEEIRLFRDFKDQLQKLKNKFLYIQALLEDLSSKHNEEQSNLVNLWLEEIKDVAYSAENIMDDYAYEMLRRKIELNINNKPSFKKKGCNFITPSTNPIFFRYLMSHRVSGILSKFDKLDKKAKSELGLKPVEIANKGRSSTYYGDDTHHKEFKYDVRKGSNIIGRKLDEDELLPRLLNVTGNEAKHGLPTIAITAFGGFGKTTLARRLYGHKKVDKHFDEKKIWICVSGNINVKNILKEMVESLTGVRCKLDNLEAIKKALRKEVKAKKFLLVLDDVWDENHQSWKSLKNALQDIGALPGSVVLMTTRNIDIAKEKADAFYSHQVQGLSEDDGWALLKHEIFDETKFPYDSSFEDVGRRIVNKCKGVPLSIIVISGLLRSKRHPSEWEPIERSHLWDLQQKEILPSLLLSYNHLGSASVKQCFAYCAILPQDSLMQKGQLISLWLSQDLLHHHDSEIRGRRLTMEEIGEKYFNILVNHSLLQEEREDGERIGYKMHDLVHDLASYISRNDVLVLKGGNQIEEASNHRHVVFNFDNNETEVEIPTTVMMVKLRTICFWDKTVCSWNSLKSARYMHTLIMANMSLSEVPPIVGQLIHLRYLDLSGNGFSVLPESICDLYQLQTLRLLRCSRLRDLPPELHRLENLRHIETTNHLRASSGLRKLTNLQTLPRLQLLASSGWTIDELGPLDQVKGDIVITGLEYVKNREDAKKADIGRKEGVLGLDLTWDSATREESNDEDVLDSLEPHSNIKSLCLFGFNGLRLPSWVMAMVVNHGGNPTRLVNLVELKLIGCKRCQQLPCLGQLPVLRILWLEKFDNVECIGGEFYGISRSNNNATDVIIRENVLFPALSVLVISNFERLTTWMPPSPTLAGIAFPSLETLTIKCCPCLATVPASHFQSVKSLYLKEVNGSNQPLDIIKYSHGLISLKVKQLEKMVTLPPELSNCGNLQELTVESCPLLACIPDDVFQGLSSLRELFIGNCDELERIPTSLEECTSLMWLVIEYCPLIEGSIPDLSRLHSLEILNLVEAGEWKTSWMHWWIPYLHHRLWSLSISWFVDEWVFNSTSLKFLEIRSFDELEGLPDECIGNLSSLEKLWLTDCENLKNLPSKKAMQHLSRLGVLRITHCPVLKERCAKDHGPEWINISHIPKIVIDDIDVQG